MLTGQSATSYYDDSKALLHLLPRVPPKTMDEIRWFAVSAFALTIVAGVFANNHGTFKEGLQGFPKVVLVLRGAQNSFCFDRKSIWLESAC